MTDLVWDAVVYLTDLPRRSGTQPVMADLSISHAAALISLPRGSRYPVTRR
jgi:hypothetical protein